MLIPSITSRVRTCFNKYICPFSSTYILSLLPPLPKIKQDPCKEAGWRLLPALDGPWQLHFQTSSAPIDQQISSSRVEILDEDGHWQMSGIPTNPSSTRSICKLGSWRWGG